MDDEIRSDAELRQKVRDRAGGVCEYCRYPDELAFYSFHLDHIIAKKHRDDDSLENRAWCCTQCNLHKGTDFVSIDPETGKRADLFNPRQLQWEDHFLMQSDGVIRGLTPTGRATVRLLKMNESPQLDQRRSLLLERGGQV